MVVALSRRARAARRASLLTLALLGCGGGVSNTPGASSADPIVVGDAPPPPESVSIGAVPEGKRSATRIAGLSGTLNHDDLVEAMNERGPALAGCIERGQRGRGHISGDIEIAFKVDPEGHPVDVRASRSDIGHQELQACLVDVVAQTRFPKPAGRTVTKDMHWGTGVDSAYREAEPMDETLMAPILEEHAVPARELCETRRKYRYAFTVYSNPRGKVRSVGVVVERGGSAAAELIPCLTEQVRAWKLPRAKKRWNKVSFKL